MSSARRLPVKVRQQWVGQLAAVAAQHVEGHTAKSIDKHVGGPLERMAFKRDYIPKGMAYYQAQVVSQIVDWVLQQQTGGAFDGDVEPHVPVPSFYEELLDLDREVMEHPDPLEAAARPAPLLQQKPSKPSGPPRPEDFAVPARLGKSLMCPKCRSADRVSFGTRVSRSADEMETARFQCECGECW
jgi:hypothetical protein